MRGLLFEYVGAYLAEICLRLGLPILNHAGRMARASCMWAVVWYMLVHVRRISTCRVHAAWLGLRAGSRFLTNQDMPGAWCMALVACRKLAVRRGQGAEGHATAKEKRGEGELGMGKLVLGQGPPD